LGFKNLKMKNAAVLFFIIIATAGCRRKTEDDKIRSAAVHFSGLFIVEDINAYPQFQINGRVMVKKEEDGIFHTNGNVEEIGPFNYPEQIAHFSETLRYLGGNQDDRKNWVCIEIYIGDKKMK
jgi:hypothetical protein